MARRRLHVFILLLLSYCDVSLTAEDPCNSQDNCESCLQSSLECAWCTDVHYSEPSRCMDKFEMKDHCIAEKIIENQPSNEIVENDSLQDYQNNVLPKQIQPQKVKLKLVKSKTETFKMTFRAAKNVPLDLYYLMDLTWSMRDDKETLLKISADLSKALGSLTENHRFGYGSFADKPAMPMIMLENEENPCSIEFAKCEPTYLFHHHLAFTNDIDDFVRKVNASKVTGNLDNLEGGFEALMQVMVCSDEIGWSEDARKIVILATDGLMHFAGDGVLAGITKRNDKQCHLVQKDAYMEYVGALEYDYPSLEEIYRELLKKKISVIFAVPKKLFSVYKDMSDIMSEVSSVQVLSSDSSNLLEVIKTGYQRFVEKVHFVDNSPSYISVKYKTDCGGAYKELRETSFCDQVQMGKEIDIYVHVTLEEFPTDGIYNHTIRIEDLGISEFLEIQAEIQKPCPCNEDFNLEDGPWYCNYHGKFKCGMCYCDEGWLGTTCTCDSGNFTSAKSLENSCKAPTVGNKESPLCSNHGDCECGICQCEDGYTGKYCECQECPICRDPQRMECICGECVCKKDSNDACKSPKGEPCSNHGICECGICRCHENYFGRFCESSAAYGNKLCDYYESCVRCIIKKLENTQRCEKIERDCNLSFDGEQNSEQCTPHECFKEIEECEKRCSDADGNRHNFIIVNEFQEFNCTLRIENNEGVLCEHLFSYNNYEDRSSLLQIKIERCSTINKAYIFTGIFLITIIAGIAIIVIARMGVYAHDKREYAKFEAERAGAAFESNPIFKPATTSYVVPKELEDTF